MSNGTSPPRVTTVKSRWQRRIRNTNKISRHIFIVCATGKSAPEILDILRRRLAHDEPPNFGKRQSSNGKSRVFGWDNGSPDETNYRLTFWISPAASRRKDCRSPGTAGEIRDLAPVGHGTHRPSTAAAPIGSGRLEFCHRRSIVWGSTPASYFKAEKSTSYIRWWKLRFKCERANRTFTFRCC